MNYQILKSFNKNLNVALYLLEIKVQYYLYRDWKPYGAMQIVKENGLFVCCQTIIKE